MRMKWKDPDDWNKWFAWYPVICKKEGCRVWLEYVERREWVSFVWTSWEYRKIEHASAMSEAKEIIWVLKDIRKYHEKLWKEIERMHHNENKTENEVRNKHDL